MFGPLVTLIILFENRYLFGELICPFRKFAKVFTLDNFSFYWIFLKCWSNLSMIKVNIKNLSKMFRPFILCNKIRNSRLYIILFRKVIQSSKLISQWIACVNWILVLGSLDEWWKFEKKLKGWSFRVISYDVFPICKISADDIIWEFCYLLNTMIMYIGW